MTIADVVAMRSTCPRASVGCVLVGAHNRLLATGYNGSPPNHPHCEDVGCFMSVHGHCLRTIHAEANALLQLRGEEVPLFAFCTHEPCFECTKMLYSAGTRRIYYKYPYLTPVTEQIVRDLFPELIKAQWDENLFSV